MTMHVDAFHCTSEACWNGYPVLPCPLALSGHGCLHIMVLLTVYYTWWSLWIFNEAKCVLGTLGCMTYRRSIKYKSGGIIQLYSLASWCFLWRVLLFSPMLSNYLIWWTDHFNITTSKLSVQYICTLKVKTQCDAPEHIWC